MSTVAITCSNAAVANHCLLPAISLTRMEIGFPATGTVKYRAVADLDLHVMPGEFVAVVGPTGCGKSTLLNAAAGLLVPRSGRVDIFGEKLVGLNRSAGYLFQSETLMPWKTALQNVAMGLEAGNLDRAEVQAKSAAWLTRVGLSAFGSSYPLMLSGGQRKRVSLAQVLIRQPGILLMDEPFGPLDAQTRQIMGNLLLRLWAADRKAVLFVTHDLEEAIALSDRVVVMSAGPAAKLIGNHPIALARPRNTATIRTEPEFHRIHREISDQLQTEVRKAYGPDEFG